MRIGRWPLVGRLPLLRITEISEEERFALPMSQKRDMGHPDFEWGLEGVAVAAELDGGGEEDGGQGEAGPEAGSGEELGW